MVLPAAGKFAIEGDVNRWRELRRTFFFGLVCHSTDAERLATLLERRESIERLGSLIQEQANISA
jgi:hypothetical protein